MIDWVCALLDGLSIPFFFAVRQVHSGTLSFSRSLTTRGTDIPDWLLRVRPAPQTLPTPVSVVQHYPVVGGQSYPSINAPEQISLHH